MSAGVVRFVYTWHAHNVGEPGHVRYRETANGVDWLPDDPLPITPAVDTVARDVAVLGENPVVLYEVRESDGRTSVYVQLGTP